MVDAGPPGVLLGWGDELGRPPDPDRPRGSPGSSAINPEQDAWISVLALAAGGYSSLLPLCPLSASVFPLRSEGTPGTESALQSDPPGAAGGAPGPRERAAAAGQRLGVRRRPAGAIGRGPGVRSPAPGAPAHPCPALAPAVRSPLGFRPSLVPPACLPSPTSARLPVSPTPSALSFSSLPWGLSISCPVSESLCLPRVSCLHLWLR